MPEGAPYLSLVATARNDDHGGSLLSRMQAFVNAWISQCRRHHLPSELIVVDWNPPMDQPALIEAIKWPLDTHPCEVRFIQVPSEVHQRFRHAANLPLYQMIAKNVGIRRARGRFVLATNIDIIFSDELVCHIAQQNLKPDRMYRIDRHDVLNDVPVDGTIEQQLAYCESHLIRVNAREGTFNLTPEGMRALSGQDIAARDSGIALGTGWYSVERETPQSVFRWMENNAEVLIQCDPIPAPFLVFDLETGPSAGTGPLFLKAVGPGGLVLAQAEVRERMRFAVNLSSEDNPVRSFHLQVSGGGLAVAHDPRILNLRAFRCVWKAGGDSQLNQRPAAVKNPALHLRPWLKLMHLIARVAQEDLSLHLVIPVPPQVRHLAAFYLGVGGVTGLLRGGLRRYRPSPRKTYERVASVAVVTPPVPAALAAPVSPPEFLHTNACGDFTLMARERWMDVRGYPEFDMYSFNIDSLLCYAAHHSGAREEMLTEPMRIYHIEHGTGSGWTPEGQTRLFDRLRAKGISWLEYQELVVWAEQMRRFRAPIIFNRENWGLVDLDLLETTLAGRAKRTATV